MEQTTKIIFPPDRVFLIPRRANLKLERLDAMSLELAERIYQGNYPEVVRRQIKEL